MYKTKYFFQWIIRSEIINKVSAYESNILSEKIRKLFAWYCEKKENKWIILFE